MSDATGWPAKDEFIRDQLARQKAEPSGQSYVAKNGRTPLDWRTASVGREHKVPLWTSYRWGTTYRGSPYQPETEVAAEDDEYNREPSPKRGRRDDRSDQQQASGSRRYDRDNSRARTTPQQDDSRTQHGGGASSSSGYSHWYGADGRRSQSRGRR